MSAYELGHVVDGHGPEPVVVLHEWMGDHTNYHLLRPLLPAGRFTWIFADLRGYGLSRHLPGAFTLDEAVADVLHLMRGHPRFHVVGHSMSGLVAQALARRAGGRVASVVAISPVPASGFRADEATLRAMTAIIDGDDAMRAAIAARGGARHGAAWVERKLAMARRATSPGAMRGYLRMFTTSDVADEVRGLPTPVTAILGAHDLPLYRQESMRTLLTPLYPNLHVEVIEEAGHYAMLEAPERVAPLVIAGLTAPPGRETP